MASINERPRRSGVGFEVAFRVAGKQRSLMFDAPAAAEEFRALVDAVGGARALEIHGIGESRRATTPAVTVTTWVAHYIDNLSGVERRTPSDYRGILRNDITPVIGEIPVDVLTRDDIAGWVEHMRDAGASGKTIANKHGLLSAALNAAVTAKKLPANPALGVRLPRTERDEMRFLSKEEFTAIGTAVTEPWRPMVRFLVASGARLSEVTALRPSDVDRDNATVRISRAWKRGGGGYHLGAPKTRRSVRTIDITSAVLDGLDYTGEWLFTNPGSGAGGPSAKRPGAGGPVRAPNFRANVWWPAVAKAKIAAPRPRIHDLRHTCASWMIAAGIPLPVIQRHLGHESIKTTVDLYGHLDRRSSKAAADVMGELLG